MTPVQYLEGKLKTAREFSELESLVPSCESPQIDPRLVCLLRPNSELSETYSRLRLALENSFTEQEGAVLGITSASAHDGKTLTAINVASALASGPDNRVLLVDLVLRPASRRVADYLNFNNNDASGITEWLDNSELSYVEPQLRYLRPYNLHILTAGKAAKAPYEVLKSKRLMRFFETARKRFDFIIVDTPKVLNLPDTELISRLLDKFVLVVRANKTKRRELEETLSLMSPDKVAGLVFNDNGR
ncbi:capsular exopolysaccharide synthesis family protein [Litorivivens lipolytica]|uniref:Capsular exopolysaccharide synthesis family protein n=1 Tax=Litorivivens lipolytica TaxID=1524264 RepID=A0A7W4Z7E0_9GAMM|nr:CpsD/CapB family tyrosine-protein kinase [Litorivivens lipolytica]MBB3047821.1 capsular exopolysaccharide synthesis family protein [Litorivivens lipolytica]